MRPFTTRSARLASNSRVRESSRNPTRSRTVRRQFSCSTSPLASEARPPHGSSDHHDTLNNKREEQKKSENGNSKVEQVTENENESDGRTSSDQRKPGTKRQFRANKRLNEVPRPPPVPDWFIKHNVKLVKDSPGLGISVENDQVVRCVDADTGHTLFEVPYFDARPTKSNGRGSLKRDFFDQSVKFEEDKTEQTESLPLKDVAPEQAGDWKRDPMRWIFMEAEASIRAAFSLPPENQRAYSLLSNRVDLSLQCPDSNSHDQLDTFVRDLARNTQADVIRLDANDFSELTEEFVGMGQDGPGTYSNLGYDVFQGYVASSLSSKSASLSDHFDHYQENEMDEEEEEEDERDDRSHGQYVGPPFAGLSDLRRLLQRHAYGNSRNRVVGIGIGVPPRVHPSSAYSYPPKSSARPSSDTARDEVRLATLLDGLLDAPRNKQLSGIEAAQQRLESSGIEAAQQRLESQLSKEGINDSNRGYNPIPHFYRANPAYWYRKTARSLVSYLGSSQDTGEQKPIIKLTCLASQKASQYPDPHNANNTPRTIVHVRELRDIANSRLGESIIQQLCKAVQKRRRNGEQIVIVGTTAQDVPGPMHFPDDNTYMHDLPLRTISVPPLFTVSFKEANELRAAAPSVPVQNLDKPAYRRILEINLRHMQSMLRKLRPDDGVDLLAERHGQLNMPGMGILGDAVLSLEQVQRLVLVAIGLSQAHARSDAVKPIHLSLACFVTSRSSSAVKAWSEHNDRKQAKAAEKSRTYPGKPETVDDMATSESGEARIDRIKKGCNAHETRLLSGVVDPRNIKTVFDDVHAPAETIDALKTLTTLSLLRPEAFKYGVLANDRLPGLLLYGPPGTGKTLLAKAVAKESQATVLEVSGAQIYEKYVGEGEKMVRAVFSLAKKLSPCIVFVDEADAIFGSRSNSSGRNTHREIINQFLREWDGMDDHSVFMMVASNRPFDLDDAVLRRLPRRLLVDLPVAKDRESILGIHLKAEMLDDTVSLAKLAEQTPLYSGSDLKNLAVAAALACVREENELLGQHKDDASFQLPEKRTLNVRHFDKALLEISASISEDMSSLTAIRKFDEQYGDRKGRRKKANYGFGLPGDNEVDESAARVRSASPPPP